MGSLVYVGGYGSGISVYSREGARLVRLGGLDAEAPSYLIAAAPTAAAPTADSEARFVYAVDELEDGGVTSYAAGPDGRLRRLSTQRTGGAEPCHLALCEGYVIAANYRSGSASVHPVDSGGVLDRATDVVHHHGHGPDPDRQDGPHAHQIHLGTHLGDDTVTVVDLGLDRLAHYRLERATGRLVPAGETAARPGSGPRHAVVHPSGHWYVTCELDSTIAVFEPDPGTGALRETAAHPATRSTKDSQNLPAGIALSRDARFLYVSNRGADTIATFAVDPRDGGLEPLGEVGTGGHWPRQFALVSDPRHGELIFVANQRSGTVTTLRVDTASGLPSATGEVVDVGNPSCVLPTDWIPSSA